VDGPGGKVKLKLGKNEDANVVDDEN